MYTIHHLRKSCCNTTFRVSKDTSAKLKVSAVDGKRQDLYRVKLSFADMPDEVKRWGVSGFGVKG